MNKTIVAGVASVLVAVACAGGLTGMAQTNRAAAEREVREQISTTKQDIATAEDTFQQQSVDALREATGVDTARISSDSSLIEKIAKAATTWSDHDSYVASRSSIINDYGVAEDSPFLTEFMPAPVEYTGVDGDARNTIDDSGAVTSFVSANTYCRSFEGDAYRYVTLVTASSHIGTANEKATYVIESTIGANGAVQEITAEQVF